MTRDLKIAVTAPLLVTSHMHTDPCTLHKDTTTETHAHTAETDKHRPQIHTFRHTTQTHTLKQTCMQINTGMNKRYTDIPMHTYIHACQAVRHMNIHRTDAKPIPTLPENPVNHSPQNHNLGHWCMVKQKGL